MCVRVCVCVCDVCLQFRANVYLATTRMYLTQLDDALQDDKYTQIVGYMLPLGFIAAPCISWLIHSRGYNTTSHAVNILAAAYNAFSLVPRLWAQPIAAVIFSFYRALLFAYLTSYTSGVPHESICVKLP
jgi:hypothetical protein